MILTLCKSVNGREWKCTPVKEKVVNKHSLKKIKKDKRTGFVYPRYQDYCFGNIACSLFYLLTNKKIGRLLPVDCFGGKYPKIERIVVVFIDAFGWQIWQKLQTQSPILKELGKNGAVTPLTALFPSTTAAAVTTLNTGVLPKKHALFDWHLYFEEYDREIKTLPFTLMREKQSEQCLKLGFEPRHLLKEKSLAQKLKTHGIRFYRFTDKKYAYSSYSQLINKGVYKIVPFVTLAEGLTNLRLKLETEKQKALFYFYWDKIDTIGHKCGPHSQHYLAEIDSFLTVFEKEFFNRVKENNQTLFVFIADHGQTKVNPKTTFYLNLRTPRIKKYLKTKKSGQIIYPTGSPRNLFLHVKKDFLNEALGYLQAELDGIAEVMTIKKALNSGLFGQPPFSRRFQRRLGEILILPYNGETVWWWEKGKLEMKYLGHHGGLAEDETLIPFAVYPLR